MTVSAISIGSRARRWGAAALMGLALAAPLPAQASGLIRDAEIERTLRQMSTPIFSAASMNPSSVNIYIVNNRALNAFVAGGRNMFLHTGLLAELDTPEQLLGVIAHETGHIAGGHEIRRQINARAFQGPALIGLLAGIAAGVAGAPEAGAAIALGSQNAALQNFLAHTRAEEAAADQAAVSYLARAGEDPQGLVEVLERFRGQEVFALGNQEPYIRTHPLSTERLELLARRVEEARVAPAREEDSDRRYWFDRMQAKIKGFLYPPRRVLSDLEHEPESEVGLYAKAVAYHRLPDPMKSMAAVERLLAMRPGDPFYLELKAQLLFESGRAEAAVPVYREAVATAPDEPLLKAGLGRALLALETPGSDAEALEVLKEARAADTADAAALRDLAIAYQRAGEEGMATLATAERFALIGRKDDAVLMAERAAGILPHGSPGWLRAQDILAMKDT